MTTAPIIILNVDDNEVARYTKHRCLRHAGFEVVDASNGADGLAKLESLRPALVLLDVRLPDVSGIELCKIIKQRWRATVVLQTSATFVSAADRVRGLEGGADSYLIEPIDPDELVAAVRALLRLQDAEQNVRALNQTLEKRIEERTRELLQTNIQLIEQIAQRERAEAALVQSQKMEAVGQLTGSMAHDFNNILASMVGYIHLVRRMTRDGELHALLDKALAAAERGKRLTMRLLAFARTDNLVTEAVDVGTLVQDMHEWLKHTVGSGIALEMALPAPSCIAVTDANQLELALLNLVINARDAMPDGGRIAIDVAMREVPEGKDDLPAGRYVVVSVADSGTGMPPDVAEKAFTPFFTTKPAGRGTGLGLSQVFNLCRLSRGAARIRSTEGVGTTVSLWLAAGAAADVASAACDKECDLAGRGERILLVDDEPDIRRTVSRLLTDNGYVVVAAASGAEALRSIDAAVPDLLLLDFAMPGMSGVEVARRLREIRPDLPVVFLSGHASPDMLQAAVPGVRLLGKPFHSRELYVEVARGLRAPEAGRST